jgi:hypothetical protein
MRPGQKLRPVYMLTNLNQCIEINTFGFLSEFVD